MQRPPCTTSLEARQQLVDALRLDLVGPDESRPDLANETLPNSPPSRWYLTGFLAPSTLPFDLRASDDPADGEDIGAASDADDDDGDNSNNSDDTAVKARSKPQFPSSIGLSVLVGPDTRSLHVAVRWASYAPVGVNIELDETSDSDKPQIQRHERDWRRTPHHAVVHIPLSASGKCSLPVVEPNGQPWGLVVTAIARDVPVHTNTGLVQGTRTVAIFVENQRQQTDKTTRDHDYAFQVELDVTCTEGFVARPNMAELNSTEFDAQVADLQFQDLAEWAIGHGVATRAFEQNGVCSRVSTCWIPEQAVARVQAAGSEPLMDELADPARSADELQASLRSLVADYRAWIDAQRTAISTYPRKGRRETAEKLLVQALVAAERMERGIALLADDPVRAAFQAANRALADAQRKRVQNPAVKPRWRAFQIAFVLMNLDSFVDRHGADRKLAELIYFPTGGGKTEAYLGVAAFAMFYRRLSRPDAYDGVSVLMRYTLRLLTLDQLGRAAGLVCAMELTRRQNPATWGTRPFEIGLWVGGSATPNQIGDLNKPAERTARYLVRAYQKNSGGSRPVPVERCPWCHSELTPQSYAFTSETATRRSELRLVCPSYACEFSRLDTGGLPMLLVDENIYDRTPAFVIATVDKFAQICWTAESGRLLGRQRTNNEPRLAPPDLCIQDELHLISGPLGTMVGAYEVALDVLATDNEGVPVKTITATATVRRAQQQIRALYGREVAIFPPRGLHRDDAYFAQTVPVGGNEAGRLYLGIAAPGRSLKVVLLRVYTALLCAAQRIRDELAEARLSTEVIDPYMTLVGYFSSLRELGGSRRIVEDEVTSRAQNYFIRERRESNYGDTFHDRRNIDLEELTSRRSTTEISATKERLTVRTDGDRSLDVALATNMISVGLDISRLGLMTVLGRPKTTSEYIQATSRVGRDPNKPGLVVTLFNPYRVRDRSHFERFEYDHRAFYRNVEAVSVTPFAPRALDRAAAPVVVAVARHTIDALRAADAAGQLSAGTVVVEPALAAIKKRLQAAAAGLHDADAAVNSALLQAHDVVDSWKQLADSTALNSNVMVYRQSDNKSAVRLLREPLDPDVLKDRRGDLARMRAPWSLRDVEASSSVEIKPGRGR
jgi:hypothetical protein